MGILGDDYADDCNDEALHIVLDGNALRDIIKEELKGKVASIVEKLGYPPIITTIRVGEDPASERYVNMKCEMAKEVGLDPRHIHLPAGANYDQVAREILSANDNHMVSGILLQVPLPPPITFEQKEELLNMIDPRKDADGVTFQGLGKIACKMPAFGCATPKGIMTLLEYYGQKHGFGIAGKKALVIGRSHILGMPMALMLTAADCTVTIAHSKTRPEDLDQYLKDADIVVGAIGKTEAIDGSKIKDEAIVIDAGSNTKVVNGKKVLTGDIKMTEEDKARWFAYTPQKGGVGPMTIITLISQTVEAAAQKLNSPAYYN